MIIDEYFEKTIGDLGFGEKELMMVHPLVLAYVGDSVYEMFIRTYLVKNNKVPVHKLHKLSITYVKAKAQCDTLHRIMDELTEDELDIVRRGRNAKSGTIPKNADVNEYKYATAFETLLGYLYMKKDLDRLTYILARSLENKGD